jgi:hypothetical protein
MKAHQRIVRETLQEKEKQPEGVIVDIKLATVREVTRQTAKEIIERYEWLGKMAAVNWYYYGIFFPDTQGNEHCAGVVVYGQEYIENLGKWDKYGYTGKIILLNRGACVHWAHPHSASKLIRQSMKLLPEKYKVVTATVDDLAGEIGTIYQACGFYYIGSMRDNNPNVKSSKGDRSAWVIDGIIYTARNLRQKYGTTKMDVIKQHHPNVKHIKQNSKHRYFAFRGSKKEQKELLSAISPYVKPYPKRRDTETKPATLLDGYKR